MGTRPIQAEADTAGALWQQVEHLLDEIDEAAKAIISAGEFHRLLLDRVVAALGVDGGAIWTSSGPRQLCLEYRKNPIADEDADGGVALASHRALVEDVLASPEPRVVPPGSSSHVGEEAAGAWLVFFPFRTGADAWGVIELVERRAQNPTARSLVRLLGAVVELVEDFHRRAELAELRRRDELWQRYEAFAQGAHRSLDVRQTAFQIANEARRVIGCDRVSVLVRNGSKCRAGAVSGVDVLDRRSKLLRRLEALASACAATGDPLWCCDDAADVPGQLEPLLDAYLDESHARLLAVVPLLEPQAREDRPARVVAVLVAEQFQTSFAGLAFREQVTALVPHCASGLSNALVHSRLPLAWLGRLLARSRWLLEARQLPRTALVTVAIAAAVAALALVPADFDIEVSGELQPRVRRDVFATDDAVVSELLVDHGQKVVAGQPLIVLRSAELDFETRRLAGEMQTARKKLASVIAQRLENAPVAPDAHRSARDLAADEEEIKEQLKGLAEQQQVLDQRQKDLVLRSPIEGQALSWNLKQLLEARPVQRGQALLTVGDLAGPWLVELHVPDYRAGHVLAAREDLQPDLGVTFALTAEPGTTYEGRVERAAMATELDETNGPTLLATVDFDRAGVAGLRPGATTIARIHCGRRAVGYVWFHDLFEFVQSHWWW